MKKLNYIWLVLLSAISCINADPSLQETPKPEIQWSTEIDVFTADGGSQELSFHSKFEWTAETDQNWCTVNIKEGNGGDITLDISVEKNTSGTERNASLTVTSRGLEKSLTITQKQNDALIISSSKVELDKNGGEFSINVKSNIDYEYVIEGNSGDWIIPAKTKAMEESTLRFNAAPNESIHRREGKITIKSSLGEEVVSIFQSGEQTEFILTETTLEFDSRKHTFQIELKSNTTFTLCPLKTEWIHPSGEAGPMSLSTYTKTFSMDANRTEQSREGYVEFEFLKDPEKGIKEKAIVKIIQAGMNAAQITVVGDLKVFGQGNGSQVIEIRSLYEWTAEADQPWCHVTGSGEGYYSEEENSTEKKQEIKIQVDENATYEERNARIIIRSKGEEAFLTVSQKQKDAILITSDRIEVPSDGGAFHIEVQANIPFNYKVDEATDWITPVQTRTLENNRLNFSVKPNTDIHKREGKILITSALKEETISIYQAGEEVEFILTSDLVKLNSRKQRFQIELSSNTEFQMKPLTDSWIRTTDSADPLSLSTYTKYFEIDANKSDTERETTVEFEYVKDPETGMKETASVKIIQEKQPEAEIIILNRLDTFGSGYCSQDLKVESLYGWTIKADQPWCHISPESGTGYDTETGEINGEKAETVKISVDENTTYDDRTALLTLESKGLKKMVTITQKQRDAILVTSDRIEVKSEGGTCQIEIKSNIPFTWKPTTSSDWIVPVQTKALEASVLQFLVKPNTDVHKREGKIIISSGQKEETVTVFQDGEQTEFVLSTDLVKLNSRKQRFQIELTSNTEFQMKPLTDFWIRTIDSADPLSLSTYTKYFEIDANKTDRERETIIEFEYVKDPETGLKETASVKIIQEKQPEAEIKILNTLETFGSGYNSQELKVESLYEWTINADQPWCHVYPGSGTGYDTETGEIIGDKAESIRISVDENTTYDDRTALLTLESKGVKKLVTITQKQQDAILITSDRIEVMANGGNVKIEVKANIGYEYEISPEAKTWITPVETRALTPSEIHLNIAANEDIHRREGSVTIRSTAGNETVTVFQDGEQPEFILTEKEMEIKGDAHRFAVQIKTNTTFNVGDIYESWIRAVEVPSPMSLSSYTKYFEVDENTTKEKRYAYLQFVFYDEYGNSNYEGIQIVQNPSNIDNRLIVTHKRISFTVPTILGIPGKRFSGIISWGEDASAAEENFNVGMTHQYEWYGYYKTKFELENGDKIIFNDIKDIEIIDVSHF